MKLWPFNRKSQTPVTDTKSGVYSSDFFAFLHANGWGRVAAYQALRYYEQVSPVATAIDLVTDELQNLDLSVKDDNSGDYSEEHPLIATLTKPNPVQSGAEFVKEMAAIHMACGEVFLLALGGFNKPPLELYVIRPHEVTDKLGNDGLVQSYTVNRNGISTMFIRQEIKGRIRFTSGNDRELWPITEFNPSAHNSHRGASRLNSIYFEIEQHLHSSKHNLALLKNGGRVSGALITDDVLDDDAFNALQEQVQTYYAGSDNAGRIMIASGGAKYTEMGNSNRDMDFMSLKSEITISIFNRLKIPLPLISQQTMTMANMAAAKLNLYDNAVLPTAWKLLGSIELFLRDRYGMKPTEHLAIDPESIEALQPRNLENLTARSKLGIYSINELRARDGAEAVEGGDAILQPGTMVPVAQDINTTTNRNEPSGTDAANQSSPEARAKFIELMLTQKGWTLEQIEAIADEEGL